MLGLGSLIAKVAAAAAIPRVIKALSAMGGATETFRANPSQPAPETVSAPVQQSKKVLYKKYPLTDHSYRYSTYGERTKVGGDLESDWGYAGLFHHAPSGLDLATFRVYDSTMGRWISRDPLGESAGLNLYAYCGSDPISKSDPSGLDWRVTGSYNGTTQTRIYTDVSGFISGIGSTTDISDIYFEGHASSTFQGIDLADPSHGPGGLFLEGGVIKVKARWGGEILLTDLLKGRLKKGATLTLGGCRTGKRGGIGEKLSTENPDAWVWTSSLPTLNPMPYFHQWTLPFTGEYGHPYYGWRLLQNGQQIRVLYN